MDEKMINDFQTLVETEMVQLELKGLHVFWISSGCCLDYKQQEGDIVITFEIGITKDCTINTGSLLAVFCRIDVELFCF